MFGRFFGAPLPNAPALFAHPAKVSDAKLNPIAFRKSRRELHRSLIFVLLCIGLWSVSF
jgi:hypothetical protein